MTKKNKKFLKIKPSNMRHENIYHRNWHTNMIAQIKKIGSTI